MSGSVEILRVSLLTTVQDMGRPGYLNAGISASGPMDRAAYATAASMLGGAGSAAIEFTMTGMSFRVREGRLAVAFAGGGFSLSINNQDQPWPSAAVLAAGDEVSISPGPAGNFGYVRFSGEPDIAPILGSRATNLTAQLGGLDGRTLSAGDILSFQDGPETVNKLPRTLADERANDPFRVVWGIHADRFSASVRERFVSHSFKISTHIDRMGARLGDPDGVFAGEQILSLVSDAVVPGDIQILGDGTPIVLLRDHQPTGGYPRIATVISADLDRFVQVRPHQEVRFKPVTLQAAQAAYLENRT